MPMMHRHTHTHTHITVLLLFWNMSETTWLSRYQKGKTRQSKTNLDLLEPEIVSGSGICWAICKVCTSSQKTTPTSHHSVFYRPDAQAAAVFLKFETYLFTHLLIDFRSHGLSFHGR